MIERLPAPVKQAWKRVRKLLSALAAAGTRGYPADTQRRLLKGMTHRARGASDAP